MALENYTRGQKIFMVVLVVLLAAMFTVTGAMVTLFGQSGEAPPADHGSIDGREYRRATIQRTRRALSIIARLDQQASGRFGGDEQLEHIYARVPAMSPRAEFDMSGQPGMTSLLHLWPSYQDQDVWCHIVMSERAREAGVTPPSNAYIGRVVTALMNAGADDFDTFEASELPRRFARTFGGGLDEFVPTVREALMIRDYVESLLAQEKARLVDIARMTKGNNSEFKAEVMRLAADAFMEEARRDVARESFTYRASRLAGGFGVATPVPGFDRSEEAYDRNRNSHLQREASFELEIIRAFPEELQRERLVPVEEETARLTYMAVRDEVYRASQRDIDNLEARVERARNDYALLNPEKTEGWELDGPEWKAWEDAARAELKQYLSFEEVRSALEQSLGQRDALRASQASIARLHRFIEDQKSRRERQLNAGLDVIRKERQVWDGLRGYLRNLRSRFEAVETRLHADMRDIDQRMRTQAETADAEANARALDNLVNDLARQLSAFDSSQLGTLISTANEAAARLEQSRNDKIAEREDFRARETHRNPDGSEMSEEEIAAKLRQFDLEIEAYERRIELRDATLAEVEAFVQEMREALAAYELRVRAAGSGDLDLRRFVMRELLVEIPAALGRKVRDARDRLAPESRIQELTGQTELIDADIQARQGSLRRDAADMRGPAIDNWIAERPQLGLRRERPEGNWTWESLLSDSRFAWLESVENAKRFLEDATNSAGATSGILLRPGHGYLILRLHDKTPKHALGRVEAADRVKNLAAMLRARELTVIAMRDLRRKVLNRGWDEAVVAAEQKYGEAFSLVATDWFKENEDIPGIYSHNDNDVLKFTTAPSASAPDNPFFQRLREIKPREGVTEIIPEKRNTDVLRRPEHDRWAYMLARMVDRRPVPKRMEKDDMKELVSAWSPSPADIWRNRHLAASDVVRDLIEPARVLEGRRIVLYTMDRREDRNQEEPAT